jgi:O-antigen/teichoic acid export membrane protein
MGLLRQSIITFITRMTITLVNIPISMIIARTLGAEGQGIYSAAITFPNLWAGFGLVGLDAAHLYYVSRERRNLGPVVAHSLLILLAALAILLPSYLLLVEPLVGEGGRALKPYLLLSAVVVPLIVARHLFLSLFLGLGRVERYNGLLVVAQLALLAMVVVGLLVARAGTGHVIVAYQLSLAVFLIPALIWLRRQLTAEDIGRMRPSAALFRSSLAYGLKGHLGTILTHFTYRFDMVLVLRWLGAGAQGYYSIAVLLAEKLTHITASVQFVLFPRISAASREEADRITPLVCRSTLLWVAAAGVVMFLAGSFLIRLFYTAAYLPALGAYKVLLPGIVALTLSNVLTSDFSGRNRRVLPTIAMAFGFGLNLLLNFIWIPRLGIMGAAWASTVAYTSQSLIMAIFFWRITGILPLKLIIPGREDVELYRQALGRLRERLLSGRRGER